MLTKIFRIPFKVVKFIIIGIIVLVGTILTLPYLFPGYVSEQIKAWANGHIQTELGFTRARLSFFEHFPSLTLTLHDCSLMGSSPFENDTLVSAKKISLGVNLLSLFGSSVNINEIYLSDGKVNILVNEAGKPNYNVYTSGDSTASNKQVDADSSNASLKLEKIQIQDCALAYHDASIPFHLTSSQLDYTGKGDLANALFDLESKLEMQDLSLSYNNENYLINKHLRANLVTIVNTGSLQLVFEENNLKINDLPVTFKGRFDFLENGYNVDFNLATRKAKFKDLFTALPPSAVQWLGRTTVTGDVELAAQLKGKFVVSERAAPDLNFSMNVNNGSIASVHAATPIEDIRFRFRFNLPKLSFEQVHVNIDTIYARLEKQFVAASFELIGTERPEVKSNISISADLAAWNKALATENFADLRGMLSMNAILSGRYDRSTGVWPATRAKLNYTNGYIKTSYYPNPISDIQVNVLANNGTGSNKDFHLATSPIAFTFEGKPFTITSDMQNLDNLQYNIRSKGVLDIGRIYKVFAIDGYNIDGSITTDLHLQGLQSDVTAKRYDKLQHSGVLQLHKINISSKDFPKPLTIDDGSFRIQDDKMVAEKINSTYGSTRATMSGYFGNIINYLLVTGAPLSGKLTAHADVLNLDELISPVPASSITSAESKDDTAASTGVVLVPNNLDLELIAGVDLINYHGLQLNRCSSVTSIRGGTLTIEKAAFEMIGSPVNFSGSYTASDINNANFSASISAVDFDISRAYKEITLFSEMAPSAENVKGIVSLNYQLSGRLNNQMYPVLPSLKGGGVLTLKKVKVYGFKMLSEIKKHTGKELDDSPDLSKIELKTSVANNIMTLEKTKLRVSGFRPRFQGQVSLDGKLNIQCRLGLPPFGIIGIPLSITGTQDEPVVKYRRGKKSDELHETADDADEDDKAEAAAAGVGGE